MKIVRDFLSRVRRAWSAFARPPQDEAFRGPRDDGDNDGGAAPECVVRATSFGREQTFRLLRVHGHHVIGQTVGRLGEPGGSMGIQLVLPSQIHADDQKKFRAWLRARKKRVAHHSGGEMSELTADGST